MHLSARLLGMGAIHAAAAFTLACGSDSASPSPTSPAPGNPTSPEAVVLFDAGHYSSHSPSGTYAPFANIARGTGRTVLPITEINSTTLAQGSVLVSVNVLHPSNLSNWTLPTPSAYSQAEVESVRAWVEAGGGLLLIADHMPFPGAAQEMATAFGTQFSNGFAFDATQISEPQTCLQTDEVHVFRQSDGTLWPHPTTMGVDAIATFTGSAFQSDGQPLMTFGATAVSLMPTTAWEFDATTPRVSVAGWQQGAAKQVGAGRVVVLGEAAMFTEQVCDANVAMGMQSPVATGNRRFAANVVRWLGGEL